MSNTIPIDRTRTTNPSIPEEPTNRDIMVEVKKIGDRVTALEGAQKVHTADVGAALAPIANAVPAKWKVWVVTGGAFLLSVLEIVRQIRG